MEKINLAELLKDCPQGMELDCTMYQDVYFDYVDELNIIHCYIQHETHKTFITFNQHGTPNSDIKSKCVIFPKGKTTWEGFVPPCEFNSGDIVYTIMGGIAILSDRIDEYSKGFHSYCSLFNFGFDVNVIVSPQRLATEEEKEKLFQAIKDNGYRWNEENKTLEKLPKFKVGDKIKYKNDEKIITITAIKHEFYFIQYFSTITNDYQTARVFIEDQDKYELVPNKFDINTLVPFESKVLVRNDENKRWLPAFGGYKVVDGFITTFGWCKYCIPYEGNEFLFKTNNDCDDFYKTWEK